MMLQLRRIVLLLAVSVALLGSSATAQQAIDTNGTTDYRNPPILENGVYRDTIVTGEAVWYAVVYTNNDPYRFEVSLPAADPSATEEIDLAVRFIGPTLDSINSGVLLEGSARYNGGDTNVWYLEVSLSTTGQFGVPHELQLSIDGVQASGFETCDEIPECDLDDELAAIDSQVTDLEAELAGIPEQSADTDTDADADADADARTAELEEEAARLRDQITVAETRSARAATDQQESEAEIAEICGSEPDCTTVESAGSSVPIWALALGALVLLGGIGALVVSLRRRS